MPSIFFEYLKGVGLLITIISWIVFFNWGCWKLTGEKMWETENLLAPIILPVVAPVVVVGLLALPLILWKSLF